MYYENFQSLLDYRYDLNVVASCHSRSPSTFWIVDPRLRDDILGRQILK